MNTFPGLRQKFSLPPGMASLFCIFAFFMVSAAVYQSTLIFYMINDLHYHSAQAVTVFAGFAAVQAIIGVYGGFLGGRLFSHRFAVLIGLFLMLLGMGLLSLHFSAYFYLGLCCYAMGTGFVVPNGFYLVGHLYSTGNVKKDYAFTVIYTGMNLGAFIGFLLAGLGTSLKNYSINFTFGACFLCLSLLLLCWRYRYYHREQLKKITTNMTCLLSGSVVLVFFLLLTLLQYPAVAKLIFISLTLLISIWLVYAPAKESAFSSPVLLRLILVVILLLLSIVFWTLYGMQPTIINLFIDSHVARYVMGYAVPASWFLSLNSIFDIFIGFLLSYFFIRSQRVRKDVRFIYRFALATLSIGLAFFCFFLAAKFPLVDGYASPLPIVVGFLLLSFGEVLISPASYAMITEWAPENWQSTMLGMTRLTLGMGALFAGILGQLAIAQHRAVSFSASRLLAAHGFFLYCLIALIISGVIFLLKWTLVGSHSRFR